MPTWIDWEYEDEDGNCSDIQIPAKWQICDTCDGEGQHSHHLGAITEEDRDRDWDQESWERYMAGGYDQTCAECSGSGKIRTIDWDLFQKQSPKEAEAYRDHQTCLAELRAEEEMERRYGC